MFLFDFFMKRMECIWRFDCLGSRVLIESVFFFSCFERWKRTMESMLYEFFEMSKHMFVGYYTVLDCIRVFFFWIWLNVETFVIWLMRVGFVYNFVGAVSPAYVFFIGKQRFIRICLIILLNLDFGICWIRHLILVSDWCTHTCAT